MFDEFEDFDDYDDENEKGKKKKEKNKKIKNDDKHLEKRKTNKKVLIILGVVLILCAVVFGIYKVVSVNHSPAKSKVLITLNDDVNTNQSITISSDDTYGKLPVPEREGYKFDGWYTEKVGGIVVTEVTLYKSVNANVLYAHWVAEKYKLTFILDNGDNNIVLEQAFGTKVEVPVDFSKANYTFSGWSEEVPDTVLAKDMEFTAKWVPNSYNVYFNSNGGSNVASKSVSYGSSYGEMPVPSKNRYEFQGWYFDNGSFNNQLTSGSEVKLTGDVTVYAKWRLITPSTIKLGTTGNFNSQLITSYEQYSMLGDNQLSKTDFYSSNYILVALNIDTCTDEVVSIDGYQVSGSKVVVNVSVKRHCNTCGYSRVYYLYEIDKNSFASNMRIVNEFKVLSSDGC